MSILYTNLASNLAGVTYTQAVYASIVGSNIGAFLTPIGALAGIMFTNLVNQQDVKFSFIDFIKYGSIISIPVLFTALGMLYIVL
jgi:arsenical pump membrane protein